MKKSNKELGGTSFHGVTIRSTRRDLIDAIGEPDCLGDITDKTQYEWICETDAGDVFTIYDWKEYYSHDEDVEIEWHIGAHSYIVSSQARYELVYMLNNTLTLVNV